MTVGKTWLVIFSDIPNIPDLYQHSNLFYILLLFTTFLSNFLNFWRKQVSWVDVNIPD